MHRTTRWFSLLALLFTIGVSARPEWQAFERFREVMQQNQRDELLALAQQWSASPDVRERHLGLLAWAAAQHRSDDFAAGILALDSVRTTVPRSEFEIQATAHQLLSNAFTMLGDPDRGLLVAEEALSALPTEGYPRERIGLGIVRAEAMLVKGDELGHVFDAFVSVARQADTAQYHLGHAQAENGMGLVRLSQAVYDEAWAHFKESWRLARLVGSTRLMQNSVANLSITATMSGRYGEALHLCDSLLNNNALSPEFEASLFEERGMIHKRQGLFDQALRDYERARSILAQLPATRSKAKLPQHMAALFWSLGRRNDAFSSMHEALVEAERMDWKDLQAEIHRELHDYYNELGQAAPALTHLQAYAALTDSVYASRYDEQVSRSAALYDSEKKERRIAEQDQALTLATAEDRRKSIQRNALIGATLALALIALLLIRSMRNRRRLAEKQKQLHDEQVDQLLGQQEMKSINAMLEGQEQERERVSKELHDHVGHLLGAIKHQLGELEEQVADVKSEQTAQYRKVTGLLDNAAGELRRISHDMAAATLNRFGLEKALMDLRDTIHINGRLRVELNTFGLERPLERGVEITVYRIIQEAVSNVLKHAGASELSIAVTHAPGRLSVLVSDNGRGFDTRATSNGVGLANIHSRAAAMGAQVQIDSTPGKGTTISVECPVVE